VILLLLVNLYRNEIIHSGFHELIAIHIGVEGQVFIFLFLKVIVIAHVGVSISLDVFSFSFQVLQLVLLGLDSLLQ
jgi:hypothetical protein